MRKYIRGLTVLLFWICCRDLWSSPELADTNILQTNLVKEVILRESGMDRHWLIRSNSLIVEEHGITVHGDLPLVVEYPKGARAPQIGAFTNREPNIESIRTMFGRSGKRISRTPMVGEAANGADFLWWPNGKQFREAQFKMERQRAFGDISTRREIFLEPEFSETASGRMESSLAITGRVIFSFSRCIR